jgi:hypothetical protein
LFVLTFKFYFQGLRRSPRKVPTIFYVNKQKIKHSTPTAKRTLSHKCDISSVDDDSVEFVKLKKRGKTDPNTRPLSTTESKNSCSEDEEEKTSDDKKIDEKKYVKFVEHTGQKVSNPVWKLGYFKKVELNREGFKLIHTSTGKISKKGKFVYIYIYFCL